MSGLIGQDVKARSGLLSDPSGHIVQIQSNAETGSNNTTTSFMVCHNFCDITVKSTGSNILIFASPQFYIDGGSPLMECKFGFKTSSGRSATTGDYTDISGVNFTRALGHSVTGTDLFATVPLQFLWTHGQSAGTVLNVATQVKVTDGTVYNNNGTNQTSIMTLTEIAL